MQPLCVKDGRIPEVRRGALDLLDVRDGVERYGDVIRWEPADHMLADCMANQMRLALPMHFFASGNCSLNHGQVIAETTLYN